MNGILDSFWRRELVIRVTSQTEIDDVCFALADLTGQPYVRYDAVTLDNPKWKYLAGSSSNDGKLTLAQNVYGRSIIAPYEFIALVNPREDDFDNVQVADLL